MARARLPFGFAAVIAAAPASPASPGTSFELEIDRANARAGGPVDGHGDELLNRGVFIGSSNRRYDPNDGAMTTLQCWSSAATLSSGTAISRGHKACA